MVKFDLNTVWPIVFTTRITHLTEIFYFIRLKNEKKQIIKTFVMKKYNFI